ncbi:hypothetical protein DAEQUDRAFT_141313 [Daedalea quercina L-15889]|uniref:Uncharacterized protein n=1 Tax=Daedalea quercina L-15889 TaxID=1314783 RepID=A0A165RUS0_9APHY|nr:hypothetical protein DAEQUDRAFT_141313 [Daedalea quercina L-15889]
MFPGANGANALRSLCRMPVLPCVCPPSSCEPKGRRRIPLRRLQKDGEGDPACSVPLSQRRAVRTGLQGLMLRRGENVHAPGSTVGMWATSRHARSHGGLGSRRENSEESCMRRPSPGRTTPRVAARSRPLRRGGHVHFLPLCHMRKQNVVRSQSANAGRRPGGHDLLLRAVCP